MAEKEVVMTGTDVATGEGGCGENGGSVKEEEECCNIEEEGCNHAWGGFAEELEFITSAVPSWMAVGTTCLIPSTCATFTACVGFITFATRHYNYYLNTELLKN